MLRVRTVHQVLDKDGGNTRPNTERRSAHGILFFMTQSSGRPPMKEKKNIRIWKIYSALKLACATHSHGKIVFLLLIWIY